MSNPCKVGHRLDASKVLILLSVSNVSNVSNVFYACKGLRKITGTDTHKYREYGGRVGQVGHFYIFQNLRRVQPVSTLDSGWTRKIIFQKNEIKS